jgi:hypothetical protein
MVEHRQITTVATKLFTPVDNSYTVTGNMSTIVADENIPLLAK